MTNKQTRELTNEQAMKRLNHKGHWASEKNGKVRVVEFHKLENGDSASITHWFDTWTEALEYYGMATNTAPHCSSCEDENPTNTMTNKLGQWVCMKCFDGWSETKQDLFIFSQGHWTI